MLSLIPQRCISRQSNFGLEYLIAAGLISRGFSPFRIRISHSGCEPANFDNGIHRPADSLIAKKTIVVRKNRSIGHCVKLLKRGIPLVRDSSCVDVHQMPENSCFRRQRFAFLQKILERNIIGPDELNLLLDRCRVLAEFAEPEFLVGRRSVQNDNSLRAGKNTKDRLERKAKIVRNSNDGVTIRQIRELDTTLLDRCQYQGNLSEQMSAVMLNKIRGRSADGNDNIRRVFGIERIQVGNKRWPRIFIARACGNHRVVLNIDLPRRQLLQILPNGFCIRPPWSEISSKGMQDQYPFDLASLTAARKLGRDDRPNQQTDT